MSVVVITSEIIRQVRRYEPRAVINSITFTGELNGKLIPRVEVTINETTTEDLVRFATDKALVIPAGETEGTVSASCTKTGATGNNYTAGEIHMIVDPVPFVKSIVNTTKSEGGSDIETDDALRERVFEAPESFSTAGPAGAYAFWAKSTNSAIVDVSLGKPA